jgi:hypothetical protein|tara:strand:+ start:2678 stop:2953 length:276 start_codon:yes stop_codon:yes gene_type:complete
MSKSVAGVSIGDPRGGPFNQWSFSFRHGGVAIMALLELRPDGQLGKLEFYETGGTDPATGAVQTRPYTKLTEAEVDHLAHRMWGEIEKTKV